jgi:hypothetical protein
MEERKWHWTGHTLHKPQSTTERHTLHWTPYGTRKRGRPRTSKRTTEWELQTDEKSWTQAKGLALDIQNQVEELHEDTMFRTVTKEENENRIL